MTRARAALALVACLGTTTHAQHNAAAAAARVRLIKSTAAFYPANPWHATITIQDSREQTAVSIAFDPAGAPENTGPAAYISFLSLHVLATDARLVAWRAGDTSRLRTVNAQPGQTLADLLHAELPPLWAPPLDAAFTGRLGRLPIVGRRDEAVEPASIRIEPAEGHAASLTAAGESGWTTRTTIAHGSPSILAWGITAPPAEPVRMRINYREPQSAGAWPWYVYDNESSPRVGSVADFGFRRGSITIGAIFPDGLIASAEGARWQPADVFRPEAQPALPGPVPARPSFLVLAITRASGENRDALLRAFTEGIAQGRDRIATTAAMAGRPAPLIIARPLLAYRVDEQRDDAPPVPQSVPPTERLIAAVESTTPAVLWSPSRELIENDAGIEQSRIVVIGPDNRIARIADFADNAGAIADVIESLVQP
jgi:hypothetical protein